MSKPCPTCGGNGGTSAPCRACGGTGHVGGKPLPPPARQAQPEPVAPPTPGPPRLADRFLGGPISWLLLTIGQVVSALGCLAIPLGMLQQLTVLAEAERLVGNRPGLGGRQDDQVVRAINMSRGVVWGGGIASVCFSAALLVVFKRAKSLLWVAASQDQENERIWRAIKELDSRQPVAEQGASADRGR